jgi:hypothetical protein
MHYFHKRDVRSNMKNTAFYSLFILTIILFASCAENLDPLSPGSTDGEYALGLKALVPLAVGNTWTYNVTLYDTSGAQRNQYTYSLSVRDTVTADTSKIPLPSAGRKSLTRGALVWYLLPGR